MGRIRPNMIIMLKKPFKISFNKVHFSVFWPLHYRHNSAICTSPRARPHPSSKTISAFTDVSFFMGMSTHQKLVSKQNFAQAKLKYITTEPMYNDHSKHLIQ